jgi:hypothetical protein
MCIFLFFPPKTHIQIQNIFKFDGLIFEVFTVFESSVWTCLSDYKDAFDCVLLNIQKQSWVVRKQAILIHYTAQPRISRKSVELFEAPTVQDSQLLQCCESRRCIYRMYQNSTAKLQERIPHIERRKKGYDNLVTEMYGYRVVRTCIYWVHADTSWLPE